MALRSALRANEQHARNIADGDGWLTTADAAMGGSLDAIRRVRDLTVQGASTGAANAQTRESLAVEIEGLRDALLGQANATYLGRSVFAGTAAGEAVTVTPADPARAGQHGDLHPQRLRRRAASCAASTPTRPGPGRRRRDRRLRRAPAPARVFATLDRIAATLRAGGDVRTEITALDGHRDAMLREVSALGARHSRVQAAGSAALDTKTSLTGQLTAIEDADLAGDHRRAADAGDRVPGGPRRCVSRPAAESDGLPPVSAPTASTRRAAARPGGAPRVLARRPGRHGHPLRPAQPRGPGRAAVRGAPGGVLRGVLARRSTPAPAPRSRSAEGTDPLLLVVVNPGAGDGPTTANLLAPLMVNPATGAASQVVLDGWPLRAPLG